MAVRCMMSIWCVRDAVVPAMRLMLDDNAYGLSRRRVTLSTSGVVPMMDRCGEELGVNLAISHIIGHKPDLIVSGINKGWNIGDDVTYSGTVSGAITATLAGGGEAALGLQRLHVGCDARDGRDVAEDRALHLTGDRTGLAQRRGRRARGDAAVVGRELGGLQLRQHLLHHGPGLRDTGLEALAHVGDGAVEDGHGQRPHGDLSDIAFGLHRVRGNPAKPDVYRQRPQFLRRIRRVPDVLQLQQAAIPDEHLDHYGQPVDRVVKHQYPDHRQLV